MHKKDSLCEQVFDVTVLKSCLFQQENIQQ